MNLTPVHCCGWRPRSRNEPELRGRTCPGIPVVVPHIAVGVADWRYSSPTGLVLCAECARVAASEPSMLMPEEFWRALEDHCRANGIAPPPRWAARIEFKNIAQA